MRFLLRIYLYDFDGFVTFSIFDKWIRIPEKKITIKFISLNEKTNTLHMQIQKPGSPIQQRSINNLEDLNLTLYHPELFESVKKTLRKFL